MTSGWHHGRQETRSHWQEAPEGCLALEGFHGRILFANGVEARACGVEWIDPSRADEPFAGALLAVLPDGSTCLQDFAARVTGKEPDGTLTGEGRWRYLSGSGTLKGLTGGGGLRFRFRDGAWRAKFDGGPEAG